MSLDSQVNVNIPAEPKGSGGKKWIFAGCGCLLVIGLICGGLIAYVYFLSADARNFGLENRTDIGSSRQVQDTLGSPVVVSAPQPVLGGDPTKLVFTYDVEGPEGSGIVTVSGSMNQDFSVTRDEIYLEFEGERIDLDPDNELEIDIDFE